jgi:nucleoside-diphosphate-sugar epimerase
MTTPHDESAVGQRRLFAGPLLPGRLIRLAFIPVIPDIAGLRFQVLHSSDAGQAYRLAVIRDVCGPFNLAAEPVVGTGELAALLGARKVPVPARGARTALAAAWALHLLPASPQLFDLVLRVPVMDVSRAHAELSWAPERSSLDALRDFLEGLRGNTGTPTPPLSPTTGGPLRLREFLTGVGGRP